MANEHKNESSIDLTMSDDDIASPVAGFPNIPLAKARGSVSDADEDLKVDEDEGTQEVDDLDEEGEEFAQGSFRFV